MKKAINKTLKRELIENKNKNSRGTIRHAAANVISKYQIKVEIVIAGNVDVGIYCYPVRPVPCSSREVTL